MHDAHRVPMTKRTFMDGFGDRWMEIWDNPALKKCYGFTRVLILSFFIVVHFCVLSVVALDRSIHWLVQKNKKK